MKNRLNVMIIYPAEGQKPDGPARHHHPENPAEHNKGRCTDITSQETHTQDRIEFKGPGHQDGNVSEFLM